jgi:hypothetical protein
LEFVCRLSRGQENASAPNHLYFTRDEIGWTASSPGRPLPGLGDRDTQCRNRIKMGNNSAKTAMTVMTGIAQDKRRNGA